MSDTYLPHHAAASVPDFKPGDRVQFRDSLFDFKGVGTVTGTVVRKGGFASSCAMAQRTGRDFPILYVKRDDGFVPNPEFDGCWIVQPHKVHFL